MSIVRIIRHRDCPETPWKNGGGTTREIAAYPAGASMDDFLWRISMARVAAAGSFSRFDGVDRVLTILEGMLELRRADDAITLNGASQPFCFDGGAESAGQPLGGAVLDLNVMARRGSCRARVERVRAGGIIAVTGTSFLFALTPQAIDGAVLDRWYCAEIDGDVTATADALHVGMTTDL